MRGAEMIVLFNEIFEYPGTNWNQRLFQVHK